MEDQVRRTAECGVRDHGIVQRRGGQNVAGTNATRFKRNQRERAAASHVEPYRLAGGRERCVAERQPEGLADNLGGRGRTEKLASSAGRSAGSTSQFRRLLQSQFAVSEANPD